MFKLLNAFNKLNELETFKKSNKLNIFNELEILKLIIRKSQRPPTRKGRFSSDLL